MSNLLEKAQKLVSLCEDRLFTTDLEDLNEIRSSLESDTPEEVWNENVQEWEKLLNQFDSLISVREDFENDLVQPEPWEEMYCLEMAF